MSPSCNPPFAAGLLGLDRRDRARPWRSAARRTGRSAARWARSDRRRRCRSAGSGRRGSAADDELRGVGGDREAEPLRAGDDGGVDADHLAARVHERAAGVSGLSAASVWMMSSISRPERERSDRPSALTTPAVTVAENPSGLPMAIDELADADGAANRRACSAGRSDAGDADDRQVGVGILADQRRPAAPRRRAATRESSAAPWTTWLLVRMRPSGVKTNPEPCPPCAAAAPLSVPDLDGDDRRTDQFYRVNDRLRVRVENS